MPAGTLNQLKQPVNEHSIYEALEGAVALCTVVYVHMYVCYKLHTQNGGISPVPSRPCYTHTATCPLGAV
jgi:hypothetical protein